MSEDTSVMLIDTKYDDFTMSVAELIDMIDKQVKAMPEEVRAKAFVRLGVYGEYASAHLSIDRPPTKAEEAAAEAASAAWEANARERREAQDREEYKRLKAKFEGTK